MMRPERKSTPITASPLHCTKNMRGNTLSGSRFQDDLERDGITVVSHGATAACYLPAAPRDKARKIWPFGTWQRPLPSGMFPKPVSWLPVCSLSGVWNHIPWEPGHSQQGNRRHTPEAPQSGAPPPRCGPPGTAPWPPARPVRGANSLRTEEKLGKKINWRLYFKNQTWGTIYFKEKLLLLCFLPLFPTVFENRIEITPSPDFYYEKFFIKCNSCNFLLCFNKHPTDVHSL